MGIPHTHILGFKDKRTRRRSQVAEEEQHTSQKSQPAPQPTPDHPHETSMGFDPPWVHSKA